MNEKTNYLGLGFGTILLYYALNITVSIIFASLYKTHESIALVLMYLVMFLCLAYFYRRRLINDLKTFKKEYLKSSYKNWLIGLAIMIICNIIINMITNNIATNEAANRTTLTEFPISSIITMVIIGPLIEEITFRASFKKAFDNWVSFALVTGFLFGFAHIIATLLSNTSSLLELLYIIPYGALGFFFAKAFYETDNIYTSYIAHFSHNALCIALILLTNNIGAL